VVLPVCLPTPAREPEGLSALSTAFRGVVEQWISLDATVAFPLTPLDLDMRRDTVKVLGHH
jgi:hypothetical protein